MGLGSGPDLVGVRRFESGLSHSSSMVFCGSSPGRRIRNSGSILSSLAPLPLRSRNCHVPKTSESITDCIAYQREHRGDGEIRDALSTLECRRPPRDRRHDEIEEAYETYRPYCVGRCFYPKIACCYGGKTHCYAREERNNNRCRRNRFHGKQLNLAGLRMPICLALRVADCFRDQPSGNFAGKACRCSPRSSGTFKI